MYVEQILLNWSFVYFVCKNFPFVMQSSYDKRDVVIQRSQFYAQIIPTLNYNEGDFICVSSHFTPHFGQSNFTYLSCYATKISKPLIPCVPWIVAFIPKNIEPLIFYLFLLSLFEPPMLRIHQKFKAQARKNTFRRTFSHTYVDKIDHFTHIKNNTSFYKLLQLNIPHDPWHTLYLPFYNSVYNKRDQFKLSANFNVNLYFMLRGALRNFFVLRTKEKFVNRSKMT